MLRTSRKSRLFGRLLSGIAFAAALAVSAPALAQNNVILNPPEFEEAPGCRDEVYKAMEGVALENVIKDTAAAEEMILKPESVIRLTCFDDEQIRNADNTSLDRYLSLTRLDNRARLKVRNWTNSYINDNFSPHHIIRGGMVQPNCSAMRGIWNYLTGNGAVRWRLNNNGAPQRLRPDGTYFYTTDDVWNNAIAPRPRSINDQSGTVLNAISDQSITDLENELFNLTNDIQPGMVTPATRDYSGHDAGLGIGVNIRDLFNTIR